MDIKGELIFYSKKLKEKKLVIGPGGNTSCRIGKRIFIKPSGLDFYELEVEDLVELEIDTKKPLPHKYLPSSEFLMHLKIYTIRPEINCVIHAHPPITVGLSACNIKLQHLFPDSVVYLGEEIPMIDYYTPCTPILADKVKESVKNHYAIVLKNHGAITLGENIKLAFLRMELLEELAYIQWIALSSKNKKYSLNVLSAKNIQEILNLESEKYRQKQML